MSDGQRSGRSTGRVSCRSTELKRCSVIEMRWNRYEVSLAIILLLLLLLLCVSAYPTGGTGAWHYVFALSVRVCVCA